jgi:hypothetical protein
MQEVIRESVISNRKTVRNCFRFFWLRSGKTLFVEIGEQGGGKYSLGVAGFN